MAAYLGIDTSQQAESEDTMAERPVNYVGNEKGIVTHLIRTIARWFLAEKNICERMEGGLQGTNKNGKMSLRAQQGDYKKVKNLGAECEKARQGVIRIFEQLPDTEPRASTLKKSIEELKIPTTIGESASCLHGLRLRPA